MLNLARENECTGCSACINICPQKCLQLQEDEFGFFQPSLSKRELCISCGMCGNICPIQNEHIISYDTTEAYAVYSRNSILRSESSSGGFFSELALELISHDGVVYGAAYDEEFQVCHIAVDKIKDLRKLRGAKYAQSNLCDSFPEIKRKLKAGKQVLFVGTPCQVAGLKAFLVKEYEGLITVDFVCHGVPSPKAWGSYVQYRAKQDNAGYLPERINLREKSTGWSHFQYSNIYHYSKELTYSVKNTDDLYMRLFVRDYINRKSCENCHFKGYNRVSDITLGDFWGIWDIMPEMDDNKGTSLVLLHSKKGRELFSVLSENEKIYYKKVTLEQASARNPSLLTSSPANSQREEVLRAVLAGEFTTVEDMIYFKEPKESLKEWFMNKFKRTVKWR